MQLLEGPVLAVFGTALIFCLATAGVFVACAWWVGRPHLKALFLTILAFAMLGFVTGSIMANSRDSAVGAVLPAVLTLLGGVVVYAIGTKGAENQTVVSAIVLCFAASIYVGSQYGARLRFEFDNLVVNSAYVRAHDIAIENNQHAVDVQRLLNYVQLLKLVRDFQKTESLDLSHFEATIQRNTNADTTAKKKKE